MARDPHWRRLDAGSIAFHVHPAAYGGLAFNPHRDPSKPSRFSPWPTPGGVAIPSWYGGITQAGALYETVFRDVVGRVDRSIPRVALLDRRLSVVVIQRPLELLELHGAGLASLGLETWLTACTKERYDETTAEAARLHSAFQGAQGFIWRSRINNDEFSFVLLGDRVDPATFGDCISTLPLDSGAGFAMVLRAANRISCLIA